jgi:hypothetical protein
MSQPVANPTRLSRLSDGEAHGAGRMFRDARELPDEDLPKLMWRIRASQRRRAMRPRLILRAVLVVGGVFCLGGFVGAYWGRRQSVMVAPPAPAASATKARPPLPSPEVPPASAVSPPPAKIAPEQPKPAPVRPRVRTRMALVSQPVPTAEPAPALPSPVTLEQALISRAMTTLRDSHQAQEALALLGEHARQFPNGVFRSEAHLLRVEALLALGRKNEALVLLDRAALASAPNRDEQLVLRGELRSTKDRWVEAKEDFDAVLGRHAVDVETFQAAPAKARGLHERALWGRAAARSRLGDEAGARADLMLYLGLFPRGRFANSAAQLLKSAP